MCNRFASSRILRGFSRDISVRYLSSRDDESCFLPHEIIAFCMRCTEKNRAGIYFENGKIKCDTARAQKKVLSRRRDGIVNSPKPNSQSHHGKHQRQDYRFPQKMQAYY